MSRLLNSLIATLVALLLSHNACLANDLLFQDDDLLCRPTHSLEMYQERIQQHEYQQMASYFENQRSIALDAAAEQRSQERIKIAKSARAEKDARRRAELIAKRTAENVVRKSGMTGRQ